MYLRERDCEMTRGVWTHLAVETAAVSLFRQQFLFYVGIAPLWNNTKGRENWAIAVLRVIPLDTEGVIHIAAPCRPYVRLCPYCRSNLIANKNNTGGWGMLHLYEFSQIGRRMGFRQVM